MLYIIAAAAVLFTAVLFLIHKISPPLLRFVLNFTSNAIISFAALTLLNAAAAYFGFRVGINPLSVILCSAGGVPAFASIIILAVCLA